MAILIPINQSQAADTTWTGAVSTDWAIAGNWSLGAAPTSSDNVTIPDAATTVNDPAISAGAVCYNLTIAASGILNGNANTISVYGNWINSGTFNHGNGTVIFGGIVNTTFTPGNSEYYNIEINKTAASSSAYVLIVSGTATVLGNVVHTDGRFSGGQINLAGNYHVSAVASGGNTIINFNHVSNDQSVIYSAGGVGSQIRIDKAGGNFIVSDNIVINGWTYISGTVTGLDTHTLILGGGENGSFTAGNLVYSIQLNKTAASSASDVLTVTDTVAVSGTLIHTDGRFSGGQINLVGNYDVAASASGGTTIINFNHASDNQSIVYTSGGIGSKIRIDKAGGSFVLSSDIAVSGWEYVAGTVVGTNSYTITFSGIVSGSFIPGAWTYKDIQVNKTSTSDVLDDVVVGSGTLNISGNLTITDGDLRFNTNNPTVNISGNVTISAAGIISAGANPITVSGNWTNEGTFNHGNGKIIFAGTLNKTFTPGVSTYNDVEINKTNHVGIYDNLTISGTATLAGDLIHTEGELIGGQMDLVSGNYIVPSTADGGQGGYSSTIVNFNGTVDQTIEYSSGGIGSYIRIDKPSGTFAITSDIIICSWHHVQGTVTGLDTHTLIFGDDNHGSITPGSFTYSDIELRKPGVFDDFSVYNTVTLTGDFTHTDGDFNGGQIDLTAGDYIIGANAAGVSGNWGAEPTIMNFNGTGDQNIIYSAGAIGTSIRIDKSSGILTVGGDINVCGWDYIQGIVIGIDTHTLTLGDDKHGSFTPGSLDYGNLEIRKTNHIGSFDDLTVSSSIMNITGSFNLIEGQIRLDTNNPSINLSGDFTIDSTNTTFTKGTAPSPSTAPLHQPTSTTAPQHKT